MISFRLGGTRFRLHPLTPIFGLLAWRFGLSGELLTTLAGLAVHESAHILAARALGVPIPRVDLMPFGGAAFIGNPYALGRMKLALVALAGPAGNLLFALASASLAWAGRLDVAPAALLVRANLVLMLFNLLPALPLDGGRVLFAVLEGPVGERCALAVGVWLGRLLALTLAVSSLAAWRLGGRLNLTFLLAAVFLLAAGFEEPRALRESRSLALFAAKRGKEGPRRLSMIALDADCSLLRAARTLRAGEERLYAIYGDGELRGFLEQDRLLSMLQAGETLSGPVEKLLSHAGSARSASAKGRWLKKDPPRDQATADPCQTP